MSEYKSSPLCKERKCPCVDDQQEGVGRVNKSMQQMDEALRYDSDKPELHHIHPTVWATMLSSGRSSLPLSLFKLNLYMDCWFYKKQHRHLNIPRSPYFNDMCKGLSFGSIKYAPLNYSKGMKYSRILNSFRRHLLAIANGEATDKESGLPHAGHALCNVLFVETYRMLGYDEGEFDDRVFI